MPGFLHLAQGFWYMPHCSLYQSFIPLYGWKIFHCITICLSIHALMDIWVVSNLLTTVTHADMVTTLLFLLCVEILCFVVYFLMQSASSIYCIFQEVGHQMLMFKNSIGGQEYKFKNYYFCC